MKEISQIAITGGKGGVGKSTVAILLANKLNSEGKRVVLCDCDVECPNDYLLLGKNLTKSVEQIYALFPKLDKKNCQKCGLCVEKCPSNAIFIPPGKHPVFIDELCSNCGLCWVICPHQAIKTKKEVIGDIYNHKIDENFYLITGKAKEMLEESGPVVSQTREFAFNFAKKVKADYLLFDTAVGMHCGVIRALLGVDLAYVVTEPTPLGAHDLKLILSLLKKLNVSAQIILNQSDMGDKKLISKISNLTGIKIKEEIPYSDKLVKLYSRGKLKEMNILKNHEVK